MSASEPSTHQTHPSRRGWVLAYVRERHDGLANRLSTLGRALGVHWQNLLADRDLGQECFLQTRGALAAGARPGQPAALAPQAPSLASFSPQQLPPFVKDLYTDAAAAVALVSVQGAMRVLGTPLFAREYVNPDTCNAALARDRADPLDILGRWVNARTKRERSWCGAMRCGAVWNHGCLFPCDSTPF